MVAMEAGQYRNLNSPLIAPIASFPAVFKDSLAPNMILDYGMGVSAHDFEVNETECIIPHRLVTAYALALSNAAGAKEILLAGFDGYEIDSPLQREMEELFKCYRAVKKFAPVKSVTPTTYSIVQSSIFAPNI
jgi:4-hydroxy 2-oxovalerate aldolase